MVQSTVLASEEVASHGFIDKLGQINKAAADSLRLQILQVLRAESFGVLELCEIFKLAQPKMSHHLKVLASAGLVATRREGNSIYYRRPLLQVQDPFDGHIQHLFATLNRLEIETSVKQRINLIKANRAKSSHDFFAKNSERFAEKQALVTENSQYLANLQELIDICTLAPGASVMEIGPGEGDFLCELAMRFERVIGIDNSEQMLRIAMRNAEKRELTNIQFVEGDVGSAERESLTADLVVCNMVLHHIASPAATFKQIAHLLREDGFFLLAELCPHDQDWVRESCGDIWLGFDIDELTHWADSANLDPYQSLFLALRNGFQIQLHLFKKISNRPH